MLENTRRPSSLASRYRIALLGGSDAIRQARRETLERENNFTVVYDSDGFGLTQEAFLEITFDVAIIDQKLTSGSAYEFVSAIQAVAKVTGTELGRILISSTFSETPARLGAIEAGAVDAVFVSDGLSRFVDVIRAATDVDADFGIREIMPEVDTSLVDSDKYGFAERALDSLDEKESLVLRAFCDLKTDSQIAQLVKVPKLKVRTTLIKVQNLLMLNTRSQLLLLLRRLDAI